jgi:hypothetical protein
VVVSALALAIVGLLSALRPPEQGPVYLVAEVRHHLDRDVRAWGVRALLIRGEVVPCLAVPSVGERPCAALVSGPWQPSGSAPRRPASDPLTLVRGAPPPEAALLRRVPLLGDLVPALQLLHWGAVATYRARLQAIPKSICGADVCFEAVMVDAAQ